MATVAGIGRKARLEITKMARDRLQGAALRAEMEALQDWTIEAEDAAIARSLKFRNFSEAFGFMARVALAAEKLDHHPEWSNVYGRVDVRLTTHDSGGITALDIKLARRIDAYAGALA
jgi:4a-hydroxytetrahydrobiopterin dehydratase